MNFKRQKFLVLGISKSGYSSASFLLNKGNKCYIYEDKNLPKISSQINELVSKGAINISSNDVDGVLDNIDVLIISPGVKITHDIAVKVKQKGIRIISELEFGFTALMPEIIAVTGTNGKTTTVNLINQIYIENNQKSVMLGNVGEPISANVDSIDNDTVCVTEVSSFQLETTKRLCPHISCLLNISPDHLERHFTMENYTFLKKRIFKNQQESEYTVLNYDDLTVREFAGQTKAKLIWVSKMGKVDGAYRLDEKLYFKEEFIIDQADLSLQGEHNVENALFAIACAKIDGIENHVISKALKNFKGIPHRLEYVDEINGVKFYNDSKSTNTASTISAISAITMPTILLLGGKEKGENYDNLFETIKNANVKKVIIYGSSRFNMIKCALTKQLDNVTFTDDFSSALSVSAIFAKAGDAVLLSPACSSLDEFSCFEDRGIAFKNFVESLK